MLAATQFSPSYADRVTARFFDAAAFHRRISDFAVLETEDLGAYYFPVEELRDSPLIAEGFLSFGEIFLGVADGFAEYERTRYRTAIAPAPETETIRNAGRDQRCPVPPPNSYPGRRPPPPPHPRAAWWPLRVLRALALSVVLEPFPRHPGARRSDAYGPEGEECCGVGVGEFEEPVVLGDALAAGRGAGLDLTAPVAYY